MKSFRDIRVIPVVLVAIFGLAVLKIAGLVIDGGYVFDDQPSTPAKQSWAQEISTFPGGAEVDPADITGSVDKKEEAPKPAAPAPKPPKPDGVVVFPEQTRAIGVAVGARDPGAAAGAAPGTRSARARDRNPRKPAEVRRKAHRGRVEEMKAIESPDLDRDRAEGRSRRRALQGHRDHVRGHEAEGCRQGVRPARDGRAARDRLADHAAEDVRHPGPDAAGSGRAADGRTGAAAPAPTNPPRPPNCPRSRARSCRRSPINADNPSRCQRD